MYLYDISNRYKFQNLIGNRYGHQLVTDFVGRDHNGLFQWKIKCDCGIEKIKVGYDIKNTLSCGCSKKKFLKDIKGHKIGRWTVLYRDSNINFPTRWICKCDCGKEKSVIATNLLNKKTKSCGCIVSELGKKRRGSLHPSYKNCSQKVRKYNRRGQLYQKWAKKVKKRDQWTCQNCYSKKPNRLESHHILSWLSYPNSRYDLNNGICLCKKCHVLFHKKFGKQQHSRENLDLFCAR